MTIQTLTFIHELLTEEERKAANIKKWFCERLYTAEDKGEPTEQLEKDRELATRSHNRAYNALVEFESHEWQ